jgi:hypothetical protein
MTIPVVNFLYIWEMTTFAVNISASAIKGTIELAVPSYPVIELAE